MWLLSQSTGFPLQSHRRVRGWVCQAGKDVHFLNCNWTLCIWARQILYILDVVDVLAGQLPALESASSTTSRGSGWDESAAADACRHALADRIAKLDEHLSPPQRALLIAFGSLIRQQLAQATQYSLWCEPASYREVTRVRRPSLALQSWVPPPPPPPASLLDPSWHPGAVSWLQRIEAATNAHIPKLFPA